MDPATLYRLYDQGPKMKYEETTGLMTDANKSMANVLNQLKLFGEKVKNRFGSKQYLELKDHYEKSIKEIMTILDIDHSGTINLEEFTRLYPKAAVEIFDRFDLDKDGELNVKEFKDLLNNDRLATDVLDRLEDEEYEKNIIKIIDLMKDFKFEEKLKNVEKKEEKKKLEKQKKQDLFESISLKDLNVDAADYLITRFDLKESDDFRVEELKKHINSYTASKEFVSVLQVKHYEWAAHALFPLVFAGVAYCVKK